ncbi:MAG: helix-turn-helix domain-containing protein [Azospirillum sp.]|nr:helix-turn-helix domain-containing protein [Azospirillum sp.]
MPTPDLPLARLLRRKVIDLGEVRQAALALAHCSDQVVGVQADAPLLGRVDQSRPMSGINIVPLPELHHRMGGDSEVFGKCGYRRPKLGDLTEGHGRYVHNVQTTVKTIRTSRADMMVRMIGRQTIAERIRFLMDRDGIPSGRQLALALGTPESTIQSALNGNRPASEKTIAIIANHFGVSADWLENGGGTARLDLEPSEANLVLAIRRMNQDQREKLIDFILASAPPPPSLRSVAKQSGDDRKKALP